MDQAQHFGGAATSVGVGNDGENGGGDFREGFEATERERKCRFDSTGNRKTETYYLYGQFSHWRKTAFEKRSSGMEVVTSEAEGHSQLSVTYICGQCVPIIHF